jgi:hypothetical protein
MLDAATRVVANGRQEEGVKEKWTTSLEGTADDLRKLARFYQTNGLFVIATLLGAATEAIQDEVSKVRASERQERDDDVRRIGEPRL